MNKRMAWVGSAMAVAAVVLACSSDDDDVVTPTPQNVVYTAQLTAAQEVPAPTGSPTATGTATMTLTPTNMLTVDVQVDGQLTGNLTLSHIHGPALPGVSTGVALNFVPAMTAAGVVGTGTATRTGKIVSTTFDLNTAASNVLMVNRDSLIAFMNSGRAYVNVHTQTNGPGEIRGQVIKK